MPHRNGGDKGQRAEREVAALLQAWWRQLEPDAVFVRTPRSGGWGHVAGAGFKARGDVMCDPSTCELFPYSVEVKWRKPITLASVDNFIVGKPSPINGYWQQCKAAAVADGLRPLLVFRGNRMPWRVVFNANLVQIVDGEMVPVVRVRLFENFLSMHPKEALRSRY